MGCVSTVAIRKFNFMSFYNTMIHTGFQTGNPTDENNFLGKYFERESKIRFLCSQQPHYCE